VLSTRACLEGGNLVNLTIHAPWYITGCPSNIFYQTTCKVQAWGQPRLCFVGISWRHVRQGSMEWVKAKTSSGRSNNASEGVDENVWKVHAVTKQAWVR
jgi:hypothetical protein